MLLMQAATWINALFRRNIEPLIAYSAMHLRTHVFHVEHSGIIIACIGHL